MRYNIGNMVRFYPNVIANQVFIGEIVCASWMEDNWYQYTIKYEGSSFCVHEKFIIEKVVIDHTDVENEMKVRLFELVNSRLQKQIEEEIVKFEDLKEDYFASINQNADLEFSLSEARTTITQLKSELSNYEEIRKCLVMRDLEH